MKNIKGLGNILLAIMIPIFLFEAGALLFSLVVWDLKGVHAIAWSSDMAIAVVTVTLLIASWITFTKLFGSTTMVVILPLIAGLMFSCKKEEPPEPSTGGGTRSLSVYESSLEGDWILKRQDLYDASGTTVSTIDYPDTIPANSKSHYKFTSGINTVCASDQWEAFTGTPLSEVQSCWKAVPDTITLGSYKYYVELLGTDTLIFKLSQPGSGYRLYFKR